MTSFSDAIINTYGPEPLRNALFGKNFNEQKKIIRLILKRDFPKTIPTWGGLAITVHSIIKKIENNSTF